ncbi:MAG: putative ABC transporter permease [Bacilli bacterium]
MSNFLFFGLVFTIYSFIGWTIEVINSFIGTKKFVNRGFLIGPVCPIYGYGSIFMILLLSKYENDLLIVFVMSMFIAGVLEYITSFVMEKIFKARWWDYSNKRFNINGRICLETLFMFGLGGIIIISFFNPILVTFLNTIPILILNVISIVVLFIYLIDNIISYNIILNFKQVTSTVKKDSTEEITKMVKSVLEKKSFFTKRLVNAFPNFNSIFKKYDIRKK